MTAEGTSTSWGIDADISSLFVVLLPFLKHIFKFLVIPVICDTDIIAKYIRYIRVIFNYLKLWIAVARQNFKWMGN